MAAALQEVRASEVEDADLQAAIALSLKAGSHYAKLGLSPAGLRYHLLAKFITT